MRGSVRVERAVLTCVYVWMCYLRVCASVYVCVRARVQDDIDVEFQHPRRGAERYGNGLVERVEISVSLKHIQ